MIRFLLTSMLVFLFSTVWAQERTITGKVMSEEDQVPIPGVNVIVKGTTIGTVTDIEGSYSIQVNSDKDVLVFSFIGLATEEVKVGSQSVIDMVMYADLKQLTEVVITALGVETEKKALGYSVSQVQGEKFEKKPESDVVRLLKGKVAGVNITQTNGVSGSGSNIIIRGYSSFSGSNQPLFIVDGVPFDGGTNNDNGTNDFLEGGQSTSSRFLDLDPNNIESISVLKGLAATVMYGENGRNGVILITTKSGGKKMVKKKTEITLDQSYYLNKIASLPDYQTNYGCGFQQNFGFFFSNWGPRFDVRGERGIDANGMVDHPLSTLSSESLRAQFPEYQDAKYAYKNYNSVKDFFRTGAVSTTSLSVNGATDKVSMTGSFGYTKDEGFTPGNKLEKLNLSVGANAELTNKFSYSGTFNFVHTDYATPPISYGSGSGLGNGSGLSIFADVFYTPRSVDLMGLPFETPVDHKSVYYRSSNDIQNPRWTAKYAANTSDVRRIFGKQSLTYDVAEGISVMYRVGLDTYNETQEYILNKGSVASDSYVNGLYRTRNITSTIWNQDIIANISKEVNESISVLATLGANSRQDIYKTNGVESTNQLVFGFINHSNFTDHSSLNSFSGIDLQYKSRENLMALYGQVTVSYNDYLFLNVAGRNDWSSTVEKANRTLFYPSVSASFVPTSVWTNLQSDAFNYFKLRLGFGTSAGFPGAYSTRNTMGINPRGFVDKFGNVLPLNSYATYFTDNGAGSSLGNKDLKPELHRELEVGFEAQFLNKRLSVDVSAYQRKTKDLITSAPLDPSTGYTGIAINVGEIENRGIEASVDATLVQLANGFTWNLAANFYTYQSKVNELGGDINEINIQGFSNLGNFAIKGQPFGIMKGSKIQRNDKGQAIVDGEGNYLPTDEIGIIGNPNPDFTTSFTNTFGYKGVRLSFQIDFRKGGDLYSGTARALLARGLTKDTDFDRSQSFVLDAVTVEGKPNTKQITATDLYFNNYGLGPSEVSVYDATTLRLRDVSLSYSLPKSIIDKTPFGEVSFTMSGQNLWYNAFNLPKYTNVDTDALGFGASGNGAGFEFLNGPSSRRFGGSIRLRF